jgi:hypothetical protein
MNNPIYNPATGQFTRDGERCDWVSDGAAWVYWDGRRTSAHRAAWFSMHGEWPSEIDHVNRDQRDNRSCNLRRSTRQQNNFNRSKFSTNKSGEKGVLFDRANNRWQVRVFARPIKFYANATSKISAILAARLVRRELHGEFACE